MGGNLTGKIATLIGALIFIVLAIALAPTMFNGANNITNAPTWLGVVLPLLIGAGLVFAVWRAFN
jgi:hypothetical protein